MYVFADTPLVDSDTVVEPDTVVALMGDVPDIAVIGCEPAVLAVIRP